jgi:hypothetical protein
MLQDMVLVVVVPQGICFVHQLQVMEEQVY